MRTFYVLWTYVANYSKLEPVEAESAEAAAQKFLNFYSTEFRRKATIYVFDTPPAFTHNG